MQEYYPSMSNVGDKGGELMTPKLEVLLAKKEFYEGVIEHDTGIMIYNDEPCAFVMLQYVDRYKIYLSVFDDQAPNDQLIVVEGVTLEETQRLAQQEVGKLLNSH